MSAPRTRFTGHLVEDPQLEYTHNGTAVCKARIAVDGGGRNGEAGYYDVIEYAARGEASAKHLTKGFLVEFEGRIEHRSWKERLDLTSGPTERWRTAFDLIGDINWLRAPLTEDERAARAAARAQDGPTELPEPSNGTDKALAGVAAASSDEARDDIPF